MHEVGGLVAFERGHELLVVDPEAVARVVVDRRELLAADANVLVHGPSAVLLRKGVPGPHLDEGIDDEVGGFLGNELARLARRRVLGRLRRREVGVGSLEPACERRPVQGGAQLAEVLVALGDLPEEEVAIGADARHRVSPQGVHPSGPVLDHLGKGVLARGALVDRQPAPGGIDPVEAVPDVLAAHAADASASGVAYEACAVASPSA